MTTTYTIKTRTTHPYCLVKVRYAGKATYEAGVYALPAPTGAEIVGYAATAGPKVTARAKRLGAHLVPVVAGAVTVEV